MKAGIHSNLNQITGERLLRRQPDGRIAPPDILLLVHIAAIRQVLHLCARQESNLWFGHFTSSKSYSRDYLRIRCRCWCAWNRDSRCRWPMEELSTLIVPWRFVCLPSRFDNALRCFPGRRPQSATSGCSAASRFAHRFGLD